MKDTGGPAFPLALDFGNKVEWHTAKDVITGNVVEKERRQAKDVITGNKM